jgi:hypothetical protein
MKEVSLTLTLGRRPLKISVFIADITDELILGLDVLPTYDESVDILRLAEEEVSLWNLGAGPRPSSLVVAEVKVIPARCEGIVIARLESPLVVENGLVEPSPQAHPPDGIYITRTLVQDRQKIPIRVLNATHREYKLTRGSPLAHSEPVTLVTDRDMEQPLAQEPNSKLHGAGCNPVALRTEQLNDPDIGPILQEAETGQRPEWKDILDRSPTYKSYWAQWKSLAVRNGILERNWESDNGRSKIAQIVVHRSTVKDMLTELHDGLSGGHLGVNKTRNKFRQRFYWLQARTDIEKWCKQYDTCAASRGPRTRNRGQMHQYNVEASFERIAIDVAGPFPRSDQGNR